MSDEVAKELIKTIPQVVTALGAAFATYFAYKSLAYSKKAADNSTEAIVIAKQTEQNTNHMKDELVNEVRKASHAEGVKEGEGNKI